MSNFSFTAVLFTLDILIGQLTVTNSVLIQNHLTVKVMLTLHRAKYTNHCAGASPDRTRAVFVIRACRLFMFHHVSFRISLSWAKEVEECRHPSQSCRHPAHVRAPRRTTCCANQRCAERCHEHINGQRPDPTASSCPSLPAKGYQDKHCSSFKGCPSKQGNGNTCYKHKYRHTNTYTYVNILCLTLPLRELFLHIRVHTHTHTLMKIILDTFENKLNQTVISRLCQAAA